jgi:hypothetical protein
MGGPETEVEWRGMAGSVMTPRMHQLNGRRSFYHFSNANFSSFVTFPFTAQSAARYGKETFCDGLSILLNLFIVSARLLCEILVGRYYQLQIALSPIGLHKKGTRL